jgi:DNA-binding transcriptional LysR family regulator
MELRHLRYFTTVAGLGSVSRAAEKLFIAQPALSQQIRQLEDEIGAALFERLPRGVRLTPAGESFLEDARTILARAQQAAVRARERQSGQARSLRLGLVPTTTHSVLPGVLRGLRAAGITAPIEVREMITSRQFLALRNDEIDLALARPGEDLAGLERLLAIDDPWCLAVPARHRLARGSATLALKAAAQESFIGFSRHREADYFDRTSALCQEAGFSPDLRHEAGQFVNVLALVGHGLGVAIVPASAATLPFSGVAFRRLKASTLRSQLVLVRPRGATATPAIDGLSELVKQELEKLGARLKQGR